MPKVPLPIGNHFWLFTAPAKRMALPTSGSFAGSAASGNRSLVSWPPSSRPRTAFRPPAFSYWSHTSPRW